jgi:protein-histidine pros-kinase
MELLGRKKDGTEIPVEISLGPLKTDEGLLVSAAVRDITERKRTEEALRQSYQKMEQQNAQLEMASRLKSQFLANMSHELRTPLNSIIGFVEIIHDGRAGAISSDQKEYLSDVLASSRHLLQLINDVLDLAKIEAGKVRVEVEPLDLPALMKQAMALLRAQAEKRRIRIVVQPDQSLTGVQGDPTRIKQVLYNYLSNAIKFSPEGLEVILRSRAEGASEFCLEVVDQGIGIAAEDHARLFKDFEQLESGTDKKFQGTGLGLSLTRKIVETMGGRVGFESEPSKGCR